MPTWMKAWLAVAGIGVALWLLQCWLSGLTNMRTPAMMLAAGIKKGIPFTGHGSTWLVLTALIPLIATLAAVGWEQWIVQHWVKAGVFGLVVSVVMHYMYTLAPYPDFVVQGKWLSWAGWAHFALFAGAITVLALFYFATTHTVAVRPLVLFAAWYMTLHIFVGNHQVIKMDPPHWFPPYPLADPVPWLMVAGIGIIFGAGSWWALR